MSGHASLKVATKSSFRGKKIRKFRIFTDIFLKQKLSSATKKIGASLINLALLNVRHIFWKWVHPFHWKQPPKLLLEVKRLWKFKFLDYSSKAKTDKFHRKNLNFSEKFGMLMLGSEKYFLEMSAHVSLKVATKGVQKLQKQTNTTKLINIFCS